MFDWRRIWQLTCTLYYPGIELKYVCHYFIRPTTWKFKQKKITHISLWLWLSFHFAKWEREKSASKKMSQFCWNSISLGSPLRQGQLKLFDLTSSLINSPAAVNMQLKFLDYTYIYNAQIFLNTLYLDNAHIDLA